MTLSHCWASKPVIRTTKATLQSHLTQLPMASLPNTFRDAVTITRALGIRYLWIDSLSIIQDAVNDWEMESAVMGQLYAHSYLTIAASASKASSGGCFLPRPRDTHTRIKCSLDDGSTGHVFLRPKPKGFNDLEKIFLQTRAWVAQERLLSPRPIHYDADQIMWECQETRLTEDGVPVDVDIDHYQPMQVMASRTRERYVAGFLGEPYKHWNVVEESINGALVGAGPAYRAPSWSWAAYDGAVLTASESYPNSSSNLFQPLLEAIQLEIKPLGLDPNGKLSFGAATVTSQLKQVRARVDPSSEFYQEYPENGAGQDHIWDGEESVGCVNYDEAYKPGSGPLFCLQMTQSIHPKGIICHCIVIEYTGNGNDFRRVGLGTTSGGEVRAGWFDDAEKKRVRLI